MFSPRCTYENLQGNQTDGTDGILIFRISEGRLTFRRNLPMLTCGDHISLPALWGHRLPV